MCRSLRSTNTMTVAFVQHTFLTFICREIAVKIKQSCYHTVVIGTAPVHADLLSHNNCFSSFVIVTQPSQHLLVCIMIRIHAMVWSPLFGKQSLETWFKSSWRCGTYMHASKNYITVSPLASLAFVRGIHQGPVTSPHKGPITREMVPFDDVIMGTKQVTQY